MQNISKTIKFTGIAILFLSLLLLIVNANELDLSFIKFNKQENNNKAEIKSEKPIIKINQKTILKSEDKVAPHGGCNSCHINHNAVGAQLGMINGNANLCMSCHNPSGVASTMPFTDAMKAIPGTSGNSHAWNKLSVNASYETNLTTDAEMLLRVVNDSIMCSTCHNQHSQTFSPFLRASNVDDALCLNCHTARNIQRYADNPSNKATHPVNIAYPFADSRFEATISLPLSNNKVYCSSCHAVHNSTSTDGNLLRNTTKDALCAGCHTYNGYATSLNHEGMTCTTCHYAHSNGSGNIYLVNDNIITPNSGTMPVDFIASISANDFGDASGTFNGVCEVCHTQTDHYTNTSGGTADARHVPSPQKCVNCHPHDQAFYAQSNCFDCHNSIQDKPIVGPIGGRRQIVDSNGDGTGSGGDFKRFSHHVNGTIPNISDCLKCHYMGDHKNGDVKLFDPDLGYNNIITYDPANKISIESFCIKCHDSNGANGDVTPFSDNITVPIIDNTLWSASSHKTKPYTCIDCHDNGHGSNKNNLLAPYTKTVDATADTRDDEEEFCQNCHKSGGEASTDIESAFALQHTHQVNEVAQFGTNSGLECVSCHNPHQNTATNPLSDPDNNKILWTQVANGTRDFCIKCHDGVQPAGITFPATYYGTGWNKSNYVNSRHDAVINFGETLFVGQKEDCLACHEHHGATSTDASTSKTGIYTMMKWRYDKSGSSASNTCNTWISSDYAVCFHCHQTTVVTNNNSFGSRHDLHVNTRRTPCIFCHDVHNSYDVNEVGLINFSYGSSTLANVDVNISGYTLSSSFVESTGRCYLNCHNYGPMNTSCGNTGHTPETYSGTSLTYPWTYNWPY